MKLDNLAKSILRKNRNLIDRLSRSSPLMVGDRVADSSIDLPDNMMPSGCIGKIAEFRGKTCLVKWDDGSRTIVNKNEVRKVVAKYEQPLPECRIAFRPGDKVVLGNGSFGTVVAEISNQQGFTSYRVRITGSKYKEDVGKTVAATHSAMSKSAFSMSKIADINPDMLVLFDGKKVACETVIDELSQRLGLQRISSLPNNTGMLFPYYPSRDVSFHMGTVQYPIDIIFITPTSNMQVVNRIVANINPGDKNIWNSKNTSMVVEVPGGYCHKNNIRTGNSVELQIAKNAQEFYNPEELREDVDGSRNTIRQPDPNRGLSNDMEMEQTKDQNEGDLGDGSPVNSFEFNPGYDPVPESSGPETPAFRQAKKVRK